MNFAAGELQHIASVTSQSSRIRWKDPVESLGEVNSSSKDDLDQELDVKVQQAANDTSMDLLLGLSNSSSYKELCDASLYSEMLILPEKRKNTCDEGTASKKRGLGRHGTAIQEGDLVVIQESFGTYNFVYAKHGDIYNNKNGHFHHDDFLPKKQGGRESGLPFGSQLRSRNLSGYGYCYLLQPTPELWISSLNHRTQIIHECDCSQIVSLLLLVPGSIVVEAGTGSGALTHGTETVLLVLVIGPCWHFLNKRLF
jgi:tRNA methyltransferase complex GCD14 subunit